MLSWDYTECGLHVAILGWTPGLHICSNLKPEPKIIARHTSHTCREEVGDQTQHSLACGAWAGRMSLRGILAAQLCLPQPIGKTRTG